MGDPGPGVSVAPTGSDDVSGTVVKVAGVDTTGVGTGTEVATLESADCDSVPWAVQPAVIKAATAAIASHLRRMTALLGDLIASAVGPVIPVMQGGKVAAMVVLALSLEVSTGSTEAVYAREPKLRDQFLQVLFDHANTGGFAGSFTDASNLILLRKALLEAAQAVLGQELVRDVLISDIARQDG